MSVPSKDIVPADGRRKPDRTLNSVVLPAPLGPITPWIDSAGRRRSKSVSAWRPRNDRDSPWTSSNGVAAAATIPVWAWSGAIATVSPGDASTTRRIRPHRAPVATGREWAPRHGVGSAGGKLRAGRPRRPRCRKQQLTVCLPQLRPDLAIHRAKTSEEVGGGACLPLLHEIEDHVLVLRAQRRHRGRAAMLVGGDVEE